MQHHRPLIETLEVRNLLSAVTAAVHDGTLFVTGTDLRDVVTLARAGDGGTLVLAGTPNTPGSLADFDFAPWSFSGIYVDLKGGSDVLEVRGLVAPRGGSILGGDGDDSIYLRDANVNGHFFLDSGEGDDGVALVGSTFDGLSVRTGNGGDGLYVADSKVWSYATLDLGNGDDRLVMARTTVYGWASLYAGEGRDVLQGTSNNLAGGANVLDFEDVA